MKDDVCPECKMKELKEVEVIKHNFDFDKKLKSTDIEKIYLKTGISGERIERYIDKYLEME